MSNEICHLTFQRIKKPAVLTAGSFATLGGGQEFGQEHPFRALPLGNIVIVPADELLVELLFPAETGEHPPVLNWKVGPEFVGEDAVGHSDRAFLPIRPADSFGRFHRPFFEQSKGPPDFPRQ